MKKKPTTELQKFGNEVRKTTIKNVLAKVHDWLGFPQNVALIEPEDKGFYLEWIEFCKQLTKEDDEPI